MNQQQNGWGIFFSYAPIVLRIPGRFIRLEKEIPPKKEEKCDSSQ